MAIAKEMDDGGVRHPAHYVSDGIECIEAMYAISPVMAIYFAAGSALKYLDRAGLKDDEWKDLGKAKECWHMAKRMMVRLVESERD